MNLSYFRKSNFSKDQTKSNLIEKLNSGGYKILGETSLKNTGGFLISFIESDWTDSVLKINRDLVGILPSYAYIYDEKGIVMVGTGSPTLLGNVSQNHDIFHSSEEQEKKIRKIVNESAGVGELKPSKVVLYSTMTCPYCKMEKKWLDDNKVEHEVIYVDQNQEKAQELVQKTGQMGVPVTEIQYEEGEEEYIVGFDKVKLSEILSLKA